MRKIEAIIRPAQLSAVREGLAKYGVKGLTVSDVLGCGRQKGQIGLYRGQEYNITLLPKVKLEVVVPDDVADEVVAIIIERGRTGEVGDGKVFVLPVAEAYRIRTGDSGKDAL